jgi:c-di-GMP-binding flagellar brake protein YcgR
MEFLVAETHRAQVRFSSLSTAADRHVTRGTVLDVSSGGMGLYCEQFVPRMCEGVVRVFDPTPVGEGADGSPVFEVAFEHRVRVRRVSMASHDPTYEVGLAFIDPDPGVDERIERLRAMATAARTASEGGEDAGDD